MLKVRYHVEGADVILFSLESFRNILRNNFMQNKKGFLCVILLSLLCNSKHEYNPSEHKDHKPIKGLKTYESFTK